MLLRIAGGRYCCDAGQEIEYAVSRWTDINLEPRIVNRAKEGRGSVGGAGITPFQPS